MSYVFCFGSVGVRISYIVEDHELGHRKVKGETVEAGARVDVRSIEVLPGHRPDAEGFIFPTLNDGRIWRSDLLLEIHPPTLSPRYHEHLWEFGKDGSFGGQHFFEGEMAADPLGGTAAKLRRLDNVLLQAGAIELIPRLDMDEVERAAPAIRAAIDECFSRIPKIPTESVTSSAPSSWAR